MAPNKPKQRILVRWNDDLDKSLLLFIVHTCSDMGIKVPYEEIARRMGSTFSEGAIVQHLSKLRTKVAETGGLVPPASKRGNVTTKPSSVYAPRPRTAVPTTSSAKSKTKSKTSFKDLDDDSITDDYEATNVSDVVQRRKLATKRKARHKARNSVSDERSSSDDHNGSDDFYQAQQQKKRRVGDNDSSITDKSVEIIAQLEQADADYERSLADNTRRRSEPNSRITHDGEKFTGTERRTRGIKTNYSLLQHAGLDDEKDEEEEEEEEPSPDKSQNSKHMSTHYGYGQHLNEQVAPHKSFGTFPTRTLPSTSIPSGFQTFDDILPNNYSTLSTNSLQMDSFDHGTGGQLFDQILDCSTSFGSAYDNTIPVGSATWFDGPPTPMQSQSSRNNSTVSNTSSFAEVYQEPWSVTDQDVQFANSTSAYALTGFQFDTGLPAETAEDYKANQSNIASGQNDDNFFFTSSNM